MDIHNLDRILNPQRIVAQTTSDNPRMIAVFEKRGFEITSDPDWALVEVVKKLI